MTKVFEKAAVELYYDDLEQEKRVRFHKLSNLKEDASDEGIVAVAKAIDSIAGEEMSQATIVTHQRLEIN